MVVMELTGWKAGSDTITTGAGNDTIVYDAVTESGGNKDTITDFTQSTLNATTGYNNCWWQY